MIRDDFDADVGVDKRLGLQPPRHHNAVVGVVQFLLHHRQQQLCRRIDPATG